LNFVGAHAFDLNCIRSESHRTDRCPARLVLGQTGFGLTLRAVEARCGRLFLNELHGLYERMPMQAGFFLLTGLAAIGFPETIGFVGIELLIEGAIDVSAPAGVAMVVTAALSSLAVRSAGSDRGEVLQLRKGWRAVTSS
jgi:hypothetical protein